MKRSILFDTETTGFDPDEGDRIIEIAALELIDDLPTGEFYHVLIHPERDIPAEATRVHGFTIEDLEGKPKFPEIADGFLEFIKDSPMIAHNARFDFKFVNAELQKAGREPLDYASRAIDTVEMARKKYPGLPASLDALCRRFGIDLSQRGTHNALLDCRLLAEVYVELMGGRQRGLGLAGPARNRSRNGGLEALANRTPRPMALPSAEELRIHEEFVDTLKDPVWRRP
ncbi:DNA polymerase III subunit epsilon [Gluconobacter wancherniae]|uniref:DNA polymerase III subunit epsilon n=1 Tax=Gluconobacter wancherniae NBRC 103581 TaxID=656744 RepID=A0A511AXB6_9PROT|nr:DNA polymerase III subunit epsilon [Gluconobacter wancherniae]MBF0853009.1 DNA polymerase III subunit epsilon [Gluconobacter wancherniae]MBS1093589.1 DNA polymerase III subunit epsilon [Gluconobacter wancherniae]GBD56274.1 DNA polymerase III subunit epsilon [Gluconobacter wancherniae NBRC 103581]GBR63540.1 DNA polymerase III subunit epsilon [Gluconobacter wancherniae NBRC 103581]GEK92824.1 DNA polymerase III subunit epsilon [Gluconobacter wancherniae NBRC 103581]